MRKKSKILIVLVFVTVIISGCADFSVMFTIDEYESYIAQKSVGEEFRLFREELPQLEGYQSVFPCGFDYATEPSGGSVVFRYRGKTCFGTASGKTYLAADSLLERDIKFGKNLISEGDKFGLCDLAGKEILPRRYDDILYNAWGILAFEENLILSFTADGSFVAEIPNRFTEISLLTYPYILMDSRVYDIEFQKVTVGGYEALFVAADGQALLVDEKSDLGFGMVGGEVFLPPQFYTANFFVDGTAIVSKDNAHFIIDETGAELYRVPQDVVVFNAYEGLRCFQKDDLLGFMDDRFEIVIPPLFDEIYGYRVYGRYLVDSYGNDRFYEIETGQYAAGEYRKVIPVGDAFICQKLDKTFCLLDRDLRLVIDDCKNIDVNEDILRVEKNEKFYFYRSEGD